MRRLCKRFWLLSVIALYAVLTAPMASAGTARTFGFFEDFEGGYSEKVRFLAKDGERNVLRLQDAGEIVVDELQTTHLIRVTDRGAPLRSDLIRDADGGAADVLDAGKGRFDTVDYSGRRKDLRVDLAAELAIATGERDRLLGVENVITGTGDDVVFGDSGRNVFEEREETFFFGGFDSTERPVRSGDDRYFGRGGFDGMLSLGGDDRLVGGPGNDYLICHDQVRQRCALLGNAGSDTLLGSGGPDVLRGGSGRDDVHGHEGRDRLVGGPRGDVLFGGRGDDSIFARDHARDRVFGGRGRDRARLDPRLDRPRAVEDRF